MKPKPRSRTSRLMVPVGIAHSFVAGLALQYQQTSAIWRPPSRKAWACIGGVQCPLPRRDLEEVMGRSQLTVAGAAEAFGLVTVIVAAPTQRPAVADTAACQPW